MQCPAVKPNTPLTTDPIPTPPPQKASKQDRLRLANSEQPSSNRPKQTNRLLTTVCEGQRTAVTTIKTYTISI